MLSLVLFCVGSLLKVEFEADAHLVTGELVYREKHQEVYEAGDLKSAETLYLSPTGEKMAQLTSKYSQGLGLPEYRFEDFRSGYEDGVEIRNGKVVAFKKASAAEARQEQAFAMKEGLVSGQGFNVLVRSSLDDVLREGPMHVQLILPSRLDSFHFRARVLESSNDKTKVRFEIDNWILRLFASHLDLEYETKSKRLLKYEGISNLEDANGKHPQVIITYRYKK